MLPNKSLTLEIKKAVKLAQTQYINHDISHCNVEEIQMKCTSCIRYIAHLQLSEQHEKFRDGLYSYFSDPLESCIEKDFKYYTKI